MSILNMLPVLIPTIGFLAALLLGRWWIVLLPLIGWPLIFLAMNAGWWGLVAGDLWQYALILQTLVGVAAVAAGLLVRRLLLRARGSGSRASPGAS